MDGDILGVEDEEDSILVVDGERGGLDGGDVEVGEFLWVYFTSDCSPAMRTDWEMLTSVGYV